MNKILAKEAIKSFLIEDIGTGDLSTDLVFDNELRAHVEKIDYIKAIASLVKYISERSQGFSTYMPVIGTGGADAGSVNDLVVYIVKTIELFKDEIDCDIHIVVSDKEEKLGLMNLKML